MKTTPTSMVPPSTAFMSALNSELRDVEAEAGPGEHRLGQHRALEQGAVGERDDGDQRHQDIAEGVAPDDAPRATGP